MKHQTRLIAISLSALFLLVGCQSKEAYRDELRAWKGQSESTLLSERGPPDKFFESGAVRYLTYISSSSHQTPVNCSGGGAFSSIVSCTGGHNVKSYCEETFEIKEGKIDKVTGAGNACY